MKPGWRAMLIFCVNRFGVTPEAFWRMSLPELSALLAALAPSVAKSPDRSHLETLMAAYPDTPERNADNAV